MQSQIIKISEGKLNPNNTSTQTKKSLTIENDPIWNNGFYKFLYDFYIELTTSVKEYGILQGAFRILMFDTFSNRMTNEKVYENMEGEQTKVSK